MSQKRYALFIGRWQPPHKGHQWLIEQKLAEGTPVAIAVRAIEPDEANPLTTEQVILLLEELFRGKDVVVFPIPDIESVNYGRKVGYKIQEHEPPPAVHYISATGIRNGIRDGDDAWREHVDERIQRFLVGMLSE